MDYCINKKLFVILHHDIKFLILVNMQTNKSNINNLLSGLNKIQEQNPELDIEQTQDIFLDPFKSNKDLDIEILSINLTFDQEKGVAYWVILLCGSDSRRYANTIYESDMDMEVLIQDLQGTRNGMELFTITVIAC